MNTYIDEDFTTSYMDSISVEMQFSKVLFYESVCI